MGLEARCARTSPAELPRINKPQAYEKDLGFVRDRRIAKARWVMRLEALA